MAAPQDVQDAFLRIYWVTVLLNVGVFVLLHSPWARARWPWLAEQGAGGRAGCTIPLPCAEPTMYESRSQKPLPVAAFRSRLLVHLGSRSPWWPPRWASAWWATGAGRPGTDGRLPQCQHAAGRHGAGGHASHLGGKLFAGCYALYAGLVFIATAALLFTPVLHRVIHRFHWDSRV